MFKKCLLASTALIVAASVSCHAAQPMAAAGSRMGNMAASRDVNDEFMCTYGQFNVSGYYKRISSSYVSDWTHVAVPVVGNGRTVNRIIVKEGQSTYTDGSEFSAGIYTHSRNGFPGKLIAGGTGTARKDCGLVTISIPPTTLKNKKTYWIEEIPAGNVASSYYDTELYWAINPNSRRQAYEQYHESRNGNGYTSPWLPASGGPYVKLKYTSRKPKPIIHR